MAFLDEIAAHIVAQGAATLGVDLFLSTKAQIPDGNGPYTTLIETGGTSSRRTQNNKSYNRPACQVVTRASNYKVARDTAAKIYQALGGDDGMFNSVLDGTFYLSIIPNQALFDLGLDERGRSRIGWNFDAEKESIPGESGMDFEQWVSEGWR